MTIQKTQTKSLVLFFVSDDSMPGGETPWQETEAPPSPSASGGGRGRGRRGTRQGREKDEREKEGAGGASALFRRSGERTAGNVRRRVLSRDTGRAWGVYCSLLLF